MAADNLISNLEVETITTWEDLRTLRTQVLVCIRWTGIFEVDPGLAIWEVSDDGSIDTGDWLKAENVSNSGEGWLK